MLDSKQGTTGLFGPSGERVRATFAPLVVKGVRRTFGATVALNDVTIEFVPGTVHALLGANGSGKSTLSKILAGALEPDSGSFWLGGTELEGTARSRARRVGIAAVFQETSLVPNLSVQDNIWLAHEPRGAFGVDTSRMLADTWTLISDLDGVASGIRPELPINRLGPAERQLVELLKALSSDPSVIILDEATASLDGRQSSRVADLARRWRGEGRTVILITHRMHEVFDLADTLSVLRNGVLMATLPREHASESRVVDLMVGAAARRLEHRPGKHPVNTDAPALRLTVDIADPPEPFDVVVHRGEVVGLAGLQGQGQARLLRGLFQGDPGIRDVSIAGNAVHIRGPVDAVRAGLALVPGDRNKEGLFQVLSLFDNVLSASWSLLGRYGVANLRRGHALVGRMIEDLRIKAPAPSIAVETLSGGNAQKVVLARWLAARPDYLLLDDPTKGIDVNARVDFYETLIKACNEGLGILIYSSDEHELATLCDSVIVLREGRQTCVISGEDVTAEQIARAGLTERAT